MSSRGHIDTSRLSVEQCWALDDEDDAAGGKLSDDPQLSAILEEHSILASDLSDRPAETLTIDEQCLAAIERAVEPRNVLGRADYASIGIGIITWPEHKA